jgi:hypothetical protein
MTIDWNPGFNRGRERLSEPKLTTAHVTLDGVIAGLKVEIGLGDYYKFEEFMDRGEEKGYRSNPSYVHFRFCDVDEQRDCFARVYIPDNYCGTAEEMAGYLNFIRSEVLAYMKLQNPSARVREINSVHSGALSFMYRDLLEQLSYYVKAEEELVYRV